MPTNRNNGAFTCDVEHHVFVPGAGALQVTAEDPRVSLLGSPDDEHGESAVVGSVHPVATVVYDDFLPRRKRDGLVFVGVARFRGDFLGPVNLRGMQ